MPDQGGGFPVELSGRSGGTVPAWVWRGRGPLEPLVGAARSVLRRTTATTRAVRLWSIPRVLAIRRWTSSGNAGIPPTRCWSARLAGQHGEPGRPPHRLEGIGERSCCRMIRNDAPGGRWPCRGAAGLSCDRVCPTMTHSSPHGEPAIVEYASSPVWPAATRVRGRRGCSRRARSPSGPCGWSVDCPSSSTSGWPQSGHRAVHDWSTTGRCLTQNVRWCRGVDAAIALVVEPTQCPLPEPDDSPVVVVSEQP